LPKQTFIRKIRTFNIDEIDTWQSIWQSNKFAVAVVVKLYPVKVTPSRKQETEENLKHMYKYLSLVLLLLFSIKIIRHKNYNALKI